MTEKREVLSAMVEDALSVEFIGLPGTGKGQIYQQVEALLKQGHYPVMIQRQTPAPSRLPLRPIQRLYFHWQMFGFIVRNMQFVAKSRQLIQASGQASLADEQAVLSAWVKKSYHLRYCRTHQGIHLIDDGTVQALWMIGYYSTLENLQQVFYQLRSIMLVPHLVVILKSNLIMLKTRLGAENPHHPLLDLLDRDANFFSRTEQLLALVKTMMATDAQPDVPPPVILSLDNSSENALRTNIVALADFIGQAYTDGLLKATIPQHFEIQLAS